MSAPTSNIKGSFRDAQGNARAGIQLSFEPIDTPVSVGGDIVTGNRFFVTLSTAGKFGDVGDSVPYNVLFPMVKGTYRVVVSDSEAFFISVPGDGALWDIKDIAINVGTSEILSSIVSSADLTSVMNDNGSVIKNTIGDPFLKRDRWICFGEGTILPSMLNLYALYQSFDRNSFDSVLSLGNANGPAGAAGTIDANLGQAFHAKMKPYTGAYGAANPITNRFLYALGSIDWTPGNVTAVTNYLTLPGNERYYQSATFNGAMDIFVIDSNALETDGNTQGSTQGLWLQAALAASTARFKVVAFRDAPTASKTAYSFPAMNWPFVSWGADLVICGGPKFYERIDIGGTGGGFGTGQSKWMVIAGTAFDDTSTMDTPGTPVAGSVLGGVKEAGLFIIDVNAYDLIGTFVSTTGAIIDRFTIKAKTQNVVYLATRLDPNGGLKMNYDSTSPIGLAVDTGTAKGQALSGNDKFLNWSYGKIIRVDSGVLTVNTPGTSLTDPMQRDCLFLIGDDPASLYYWNEADKSYRLLVTAPTATLWAGARTRLAAPTLDHVDGENINAVNIDHADTAVTILYSINGGAWTTLTSWPTKKNVYYEAPGPWWIAAIARKTARLDSVPVYASFYSIWQQDL